MLVGILRKYSLASGQQINYEKSSVYFGKNIPEQRRVLIKAKTGISQDGGGSIYLGLPESFGPSKVNTLRYIKARLQNKVVGWRNNFLSPAGKEVLLKAVAMAHPNFSMSCFLLPKTTCQQIEVVMADFWWRNSKDSKGMHWKNWKHLCKPKSEGGLAFKDLEAFNLAMLGKQVWRILTKQENLVERVFKARYFPRTSILNAPLGSRPSYAWRGLHVAQKLI